MGSSTAAGKGASPGKGWVSLLATEIPVRGNSVINIAKPGSVTYTGLSSASAPVAGRPAPDPLANIDQALSRKPVMLILAYPTNDIAAGYGREEVIRNLTAIQSQASAAKVAVIILSSQPRNLPASQLADLRAIDDRLAASAGPCFVNVRDILAGSDGRPLPELNSGDGIHPNDAGHRKIASAVESTINGGACVRLVP